MKFMMYRFLLPVATIFVPLALWRNEVLATVVLLCVFAVFMRIREHRRHFRIFVYAAVFGPVSEVLCILAGAWSYSSASYFVIPLWLPLVWGMAGIHMSEVNENLSKK